MIPLVFSLASLPFRLCFSQSLFSHQSSSFLFRYFTYKHFTVHIINQRARNPIIVWVPLHVACTPLVSHLDHCFFMLCNKAVIPAVLVFTFLILLIRALVKTALSVGSLSLPLSVYKLVCSLSCFFFTCAC